MASRFTTMCGVLLGMGMLQTSYKQITNELQTNYKRTDQPVRERVTASSLIIHVIRNIFTIFMHLDLDLRSYALVYTSSFIVLAVRGRSVPATKWQATQCPRDNMAGGEMPRDETAGDELYPRRNGRRRNGGYERRCTLWTKGPFLSGSKSFTTDHRCYGQRSPGGGAHAKTK